MGSPDAAADLALFRRKEIVAHRGARSARIGDLAEITEELSNLADAILTRALEEVTAELEGAIRQSDRRDRRSSEAPAALTVLALGKAGRQRAELQLRHRPDVSLQRQRRDIRSAADHQQRVLQESCQSAYGACCPPIRRRASVTGWILRLRPEGSHGEVCISLGGGEGVLREASAGLGAADAA